MAKYNSEDKVLRGVYGYFIGENLLYVGSSSLPLDRLSYNHRNWQSKNYSPTLFRRSLVQPQFSSGNFKWIHPPEPRTLREVEDLEGQTIRTNLPKFNIDKDPVSSSVRYGRYSAS